ncbi:PQQ-binding-like beta-propeller repeat protein [Kribbella sp. NPDC005582]|uniref:outer membrane protein assembly factor BamB family protein n=1 Tax=Kribbella sp. NPDC005582 TaxID=3156893 RepID=UPI0033A5E1A9
MKRRIVAIVAGVAVIAAGGVLIVRPWWAGRCSASFEEVPAAEMTKLHAVPLDQVDPNDFSGATRTSVRELLVAAQHPAAPLGRARSAVVVPHKGGVSAARLINSHDGDVRFEIDGGGLIGTEYSGAVVQVDGETGKAVWGRRQVGYGVGGGNVADRMMLMHIPRGKAPRVAAVNPTDGELDWCTTLGKDHNTSWRPTFDSAASGDAIFVVRESDAEQDSKDDNARDVRLSRLDAGSGKVKWNKPVENLSQADSLHVLRDQLLLSPYRLDMNVDSWARITDPASTSKPVSGAIVARSAADGTRSWTYRGPDQRGWINNVLGTGKDVAVVISRRSSQQGKRSVSESWLTGIDRTGKEVWKHDFKGQFDYFRSESFLVTGDLVISHESRDPKTDRSELVARSLTDGTERWRAQLTGIGAPLRRRSSEIVGNSLLTTSAAAGLMAVDLGSGAVTNPLPGEKFGRIDSIVSDGRTVTIDANGLFLTFDRAF